MTGDKAAVQIPAPAKGRRERAAGGWSDGHSVGRVSQTMLEMADLLIAAGANVKTPNRDGATALSLASPQWERGDDREAVEGRRGPERACSPRAKPL